MIASLMMYQRPQLEDVHNRYWALIRENLAAYGINSPEALSQDAEEFSVWNDPELVLSQTCGMPYRNDLHDKVTLIGTPDFALHKCEPGYYRSAFIIRKSDQRDTLPAFRQAVFAYNQQFSQSGYAAPFQHLKTFGFWFNDRLHTHQHLQSARAVATGRADIASLDAVSWRLMQEYEDFASDLRVLEWTQPTPGLPYIAAAGVHQQHNFDAIKRAISQLSPEDKKHLGIKTLVYIAPQDYLAVPNPDE